MPLTPLSLPCGCGSAAAGFSVVRMRSTCLEQQGFEALMLELDANLLLAAALGHRWEQHADVAGWLAGCCAGSVAVLAGWQAAELAGLLCWREAASFVGSADVPGTSQQHRSWQLWLAAHCAGLNFAAAANVLALTRPAISRPCSTVFSPVPWPSFCTLALLPRCPAASLSHCLLQLRRVGLRLPQQAQRRAARAVVRAGVCALRAAAVLAGRRRPSTPAGPQRCSGL